MPAWSCILRGGWLFDGDGGEPRRGDLAVADERIDAVGRLPAEAVAGAGEAKVLDCSGLAVAPGFIDVHTHSDLTLLAAPEADTHVCQGVTTDICGNCGFSAFPVGGARAERIAEERQRLGIKAEWSDLPGFLKQAERTPAALNRALLVGHGAVRASVLGYGDRQPNGTELEAMRAEVRAAMELGCLGLSSGLIYPPGMYASTDELVALAAVAAQAGGIYTSHVRGEGAHLEESLDEFLRIARESGAPAQFSHIKVSGQEYWHKIDLLVERLEQARRGGLRVTADRYPYTASETGLDVLLPKWAFDGGQERELQRLADRATRSRLAREILAANPAPEFWERVVLGSVVEPALRELQGRSVAEIAAARGGAPVEVYLDLLVEDRARSEAMYHKLSEEHLERLLALDWVMIGSDSSARGSAGPSSAGHPHPRGCGTFPRVLARYVREKQVLSLGEAVRRMTSLPAETFGLERRGRLREGFYADLVVFDPAKVADGATYGSPKKPPEGIVHVLVNGRPVMLGGARTPDRPGRILRREARR